MLVDVFEVKLYEDGAYLKGEIESFPADLTEYRDDHGKITAYMRGCARFRFMMEPDVSRLYYEVPALDYVTGFKRDSKAVLYGA